MAHWRTKPFIAKMIAIAGFVTTAIPATATYSDKKQTTANESEILVIGQRGGKQRFHNFVKTVVKETDSGQYSRIRAPVCPSVQGLKRNANKYVELRIRNIAEAVGLRLAKKKCRANISVIIVEDGREFLTGLRKKQPNLFEELAPPERDRLIKGPGPAYSWKSASVIGIFGGSSIRSMGEIIGSENSMAGGTQIKDGSRAPMSKIIRAVANDIKGSFLVIEASALIGNNLTQIADYAAVRSFVDVDDRNIDEIGESSILTLFRDRTEKATPMEHISDWDLATINALYHTTSNIDAFRQRAAMVGKIEADVRKMETAALQNDN